MRFVKVKVTVALAIASALLTLGCDFRRGSTLSYQQSVQTWDLVPADDCIVVGAYVFGLDTTMPPSQGKASIQMRTEMKEYQEFLPNYVYLSYFLNGGFLYQQAFELKNGKGSIKEELPYTWNFMAGDELEYQFCTESAEIPIHTEISLSLSYKLDK